MWSLSKEITTEDDLFTLGVTGLKLSRSVIQTALTNHSKDITSASHAVLQKWIVQQENRDDAFTDLQAALRQCEMSHLASQLVKDFNDVSQERQMSKQREYLCAVSFISGSKGSERP